MEKNLLNSMYGKIVTNNIDNSSISFYGLARTIEVLNDLLKDYDLVNLESYKIKDVIECIIKLDEQIEKHINNKGVFVKCEEGKNDI